MNYLYVMDIVKAFNPNVSSRFSENSSKLIQETISNIIHRLIHIINRSLNTGIIPYRLKLANVIPVFKASHTALLAYYLQFLKYQNKL